MKKYESKDAAINPTHYQTDKGFETIDVIEAFTADLVGIEATDTGNIIKYVCRWKKKNGLQDLEKAMWYLQHLIEHVKTCGETHICISNKMPQNERAELFGRLIDVVEDWLEEKGIGREDIPNHERSGDDDDAIVYGSDYDYLADCFASVIGISRDNVDESCTEGE